MNSNQNIIRKWQDDMSTIEQANYTISELDRQIELYADLPSFQKGLIRTVKVLKEYREERFLK